MKRLAALLAVSAVFAVAACDNPPPAEDEGLADKAAEQAPAPVIEEPVVEAPAPVTPPPTDSTTLPPEKRTSEESVQPESETLFY
ncbi:hypothetical protein [Brevundimonas sp. FT23028]|uniref:hypothetical protein n=1 Tax=Brevundimonas sp. FT23028 TaxID=3393748 RepID=UPI003B586C55